MNPKRHLRLLTCLLGGCTTTEINSCFVAGVQVRTPDGPRAIESLVIGEVVLAVDVETGVLVPRPIVAVLRAQVERILVIDAGTFRIDGVSPEHPFWDPVERAWRAAGDLRVGDPLLAASGGAFHTVSITSIEAQEQPGIEVYNLTVDGTPTYLANDLVVHNKSPVDTGPVYVPPALAAELAIEVDFPDVGVLSGNIIYDLTQELHRVPEGAFWAGATGRAVVGLSLPGGLVADGSDVDTHGLLVQSEGVRLLWSSLVVTGMGLEEAGRGSFSVDLEVGSSGEHCGSGVLSLTAGDFDRLVEVTVRGHDAALGADVPDDLCGAPAADTGQDTSDSG